MSAARVFAATRQITGAGYLHHAYVYVGNKVVMSCMHDHRSQRTAQKCADVMLRRYQRRHESNGGAS